MQDGKSNLGGPEASATNVDLEGALPPAADEAVREKEDTVRNADPEGKFSIGTVLPAEIFEITGVDPLEGDEFVGVNSEGYAVLERDLGGGRFNQQEVNLEGLHRALALLGEEDPHAPHAQHGPHVATVNEAAPAEEAAVLPIHTETSEREPLSELMSELRDRLDGELRARNILQHHAVSPARRAYAEKYLDDNFTRFSAIAHEMGVSTTDPRELLVVVERMMEVERGETSPSPEDDQARQLTKRLRRDEVIAFAEQGKLNSIPLDVLYRFRFVPEVRNAIAVELAQKTSPDKIAELDAIHGHDWRFEVARNAPGISAEDRKSIADYLKARLVAEVGSTDEKPERSTAIEQLRGDFGGDVRFLYQGKDNIVMDRGGLDEPASKDNIDAVLDELASAGLSQQEIEAVVKIQKNRAKNRERLKTNDALFPFDLIELRRRVIGQKVSKEIAANADEYTRKDFKEADLLEQTARGVMKKEFSDAAKLPPLTFTAEIGELDEIGGNQEGEIITSLLQLQAPIVLEPIAPPPAAPSFIVDFPVLTEIVPESELRSNVVSQKQNLPPSEVPTLTDVVTLEELKSKAPLTPNQKFTQTMRELEREADVLAKKSGLLPEEKAKLAALEQEMIDLEAAYLLARTSTNPDVVDQSLVTPEVVAAVPVVLTEVNAVPSLATPELPPVTPSPEHASISSGVLNKFEAALGLNVTTLEKIPGFKELSSGKQLLILRNMQNEVLQGVSKEADKEQKAEWKGRSLWGKIWRGAATMGSYQFARTKAIEKELLLRASGDSVNDTKQQHILAEHAANIEEYVKVMQGAPEVTEKNGELVIAYAASQGESVTSEEKKVLENFNAVASRFATVPREWGYEPSDEKEKGQRKQFDEGKAQYDAARASLLALYKESYSKEGSANPEKEAMSAMHRIDERLALDQLYNAHPNAEKVLEQIEDQNAITAGIKEFWRDKGRYVALGVGVRVAVTAVFGAVTGGFGAVGLATGVGTFVGGMQGVAEAKKIVRTRRIDRRLSEEDEREEISYKDSTGTSHLRKIKEHTDATVFVDRIERLSDKLEQATTPEERNVLESKIAKTTALMEEKFKLGLINFGGSSLEGGDERKGNDIANKLSFIEAMGKGALTEVVDTEKLKNEMRRIVGGHQEKIEDVRDEEIMKAGMKAALIRGSFALGGSYLAGKIHESGIADTFFRKIEELNNQTTDGGIGRGEADAITLHNEDVAAPSAAASAASAPSAAASAASAPEAAASAVRGEMVSIGEANSLAHDYLTADMVSHDTAASELLSQEWRFMSSKNAESILAITKEQAVQSPGGADMWSSILHMQAYAKANGFTPAEGIVPKSSETLEQFFLRAHAEHIMKYGVVPRVHDAPIPAPRIGGVVPPELAPMVAPNPPSQEVLPPLKPFSEQQVRVPSWQNKPATGAAPKVDAPAQVIPPPTRPEFMRGTSSAFPNGLPPPPPPPIFIEAPAPGAIPPPPPRPAFLGALQSEAPAAPLGASAESGFAKTSFTEGNFVQAEAPLVRMNVAEVTRAPYSGVEQGADKLLAPMLAQARSSFGAAVDRPAIEVMSELKASGDNLYRPFELFLQKGYAPKQGESIIAFYERCAKEELLQVKMPTQTVEHAANEQIPTVTKEARFERNVDRLWGKLLWKNSQHEYLTDKKNTVEDLLNGNIVASSKDVNGNSLRYWQGSIRNLIKKSGVVPQHGEQVEAYGKRAVAEMFRKNPALTREDILSGMTIEPAPAPAPKEVELPSSTQVEQIAQVEKPKLESVIAAERAVKFTRLVADKWDDVAQRGLSGNSHWQGERSLSVEVIQSKQLRDVVPGSPEEADVQLQGLIKKAGGMGFAPSVGESAGAYLDRIAKELHEPLSAERIVNRTNNIVVALKKFMPAKTNFGEGISAEYILANKDLAKLPKTAEVNDLMIIQKVLSRIQQNTGIAPNKDESPELYLSRAVSEQLRKTPELHASTLLAPKGAAFQSADVPPASPAKVPLKDIQPPSIKPPLRWSQQA